MNLLLSRLYSGFATEPLLEGGWFPLLIATAAFMMLTWRKGQQLVKRARTHLRMSTGDFLQMLKDHPPIRIPGAAVVMSASQTGIPGTLLHHLKHNRVLHEQVFLVSVVVTDYPTVTQKHRVHIAPIGDGVPRLILRLGFAEKPNVPVALRLAARDHHLADLDPDNITYYVGRQTVVATRALPGMAFWREVILAILNRNAELTADYFCIPASQVVEIGSSIEI